MQPNLPVIHPAIFRQGGEGANSCNVNKTRNGLEAMSYIHVCVCVCVSKLLSSSCELSETILSLTWDLWRRNTFLFDTLSSSRASLCRVSEDKIKEYWISIEFNSAWRRSKTLGSMSGTQEEDSSLVMAAQAIKLKPRSSGGSPCESPNTKLSPRNSPRNSPVLFRKLLMNRSIVLQRRFTLAHTPRYYPTLFAL